MTSDSSELREAITRSRAGQIRWRCPRPLRARIVAFTQQRQQAGISIEKTARELGVSASGLTRWLQAGEPRLRPVRIAEAPTESPSPDSLVLVTPGGYRLEGLSPASAADLLRRMAC